LNRGHCPSCWASRISAAASAAYLTVGECFPLEVRALTIALFYAFGTGVGGVAGPAAASRTGARSVARIHCEDKKT